MAVDVSLWLEKSKTVGEKDRKGTGLFIRQQDSESWWALREACRGGGLLKYKDLRGVLSRENFKTGMKAWTIPLLFITTLH